jgi:hypothetical protein
MEEKTRHFLWGTVLYFFDTALFAILGPIFRSVRHLTYSQMYALQVLGEVVSFLPMTPYAVRHWNITTWKEWGIYLFLTFASAFRYILYNYCSHVMPFGDLATLEVSGILLAPVMGAILYRRSLYTWAYGKGWRWTPKSITRAHHALPNDYALCNYYLYFYMGRTLKRLKVLL